ncbi:MAG: ribose-5-phosphate isomerase RpiA [Burkholderiales bacterium]|nr:ribose-5-phosphate isomerase RpiA [Burkholderiales bacterium]
MSDALTLKKAVAREALRWVEPGSIIGVGTGSTVDCFIDALGQSGIALAGAVSSSNRTEEKLRSVGVAVLDLNDVVELGVYIDGADEIDPALNLIKGGGGALTREKVVAEAARLFVCIADASKEVAVLGNFALPIEVLPIASALIQRKVEEMGGIPKLRSGFITDNGNIIIDVSGLSITDPQAMESKINQWPGVVTCGLFALRKADVACIATPDGVRVSEANKQ